MREQWEPMPPEFTVRVYLNGVLVAIRHVERGNRDPSDLATEEANRWLAFGAEDTTQGGLLPGTTVRAVIYEGGSDNPMAICDASATTDDNVYLVSYQLDGSAVSGGVSGTRGVRTELGAADIAELSMRRMIRHYHRPGKYRVDVYPLQGETPLATVRTSITDPVRVPKPVTYARRP